MRPFCFYESGFEQSTTSLGTVDGKLTRLKTRVQDVFHFDYPVSWSPSSAGRS